MGAWLERLKQIRKEAFERKKGQVRTALASACEEASRECVENIMDSYSPHFRTQSLENSVTHTVTFSECGDGMRCSVTSQMNVEMFWPNTASAQAWLDRHPEAPSRRPPNVYIYGLIVDDGMIGVPGYGGKQGPAFDGYMANHPEWTTWIDRVMTRLPF